MPTITELWRYPVKSMQGERIDATVVTGDGVVSDRRWALIDVETGHVATAKLPRKWGSLLEFRAALVDDDTVQVTTPHGATVRSDDPDVDAVLSKSIGRDVRLAASAPEDRRYEMLFVDEEGVAPMDEIAKVRVGDEPDGVLTDLALGLAAPPQTFFDVSTLHLITAATLTAVGGDRRRFRPNIVIADDGDGYVENGWVGATLALGADVRASVFMATMRCVMTTLPQPELDRDRGILQTLARDNRIEIPGMGTWACAGVYAAVAAAGTVVVGDRVSVS